MPTLVSVLDLAAELGLPRGREIAFYCDRIAAFDQQFGTRTPMLRGWKDRPAVPEWSASELVAAFAAHRAAAGRVLEEARAAGVPPAVFSSTDQQEMARRDWRSQAEGKARRVQQARAAGWSEQQIGLYLARLDEAQASRW